MAMPITNRPISSEYGSHAIAVSMVTTMNAAIAQLKRRLRPNRSASEPPTSAPTAAPATTEAAIAPTRNEGIAICWSISGNATAMMKRS